MPSSKELFIDKLTTLLDRESIKIHDEITLDELRNMVKKHKGTSVRMEAKRGHHDDTVMALAIYAGSLSMP